MRNEKGHWWQDDYGDWKVPVVIASFVLGVAAIVLLCVGISAYSSTQGCGAKGDAYHLATHYNFWANTCFAELPNGNVVNTNNLQQDSRGYTIYTPDTPQAVPVPVPVQK